MPWFPDFANAAELAREATRDSAYADPAAEYLHALNDGEARGLERAWPGEVVVLDPRAGEIRGHRPLRHFVRTNHAWFAAHDAAVETVATTRTDGRAVLELLVTLTGDDGESLSWPVAVVAESSSEDSIVFRTYCSQLPVAGRRPVRPAILAPRDEHPGDVVAGYQTALDIGDVDAIVGAFGPDGYYREPIGPNREHRGAAELRAFFTERFSDGGIGMQSCAVTDDGVRCALEYNAIRWGSQTMVPQAGLGIYERGADGLLAAVRGYDDVLPPAGR
ncbi:MAG TPA: nuclear transport factor 2 family protein [Mycobacteriales bacterium]|jgi:hypothetical protein|nr:nuclear transport factor 2 family protein [Mycobacteriales bacterium]